MTCTRIRKLIPLAVSRDLEPSVVRAVEDHAKACLACYRELRAYAEQLDLRAGLAPAALDVVPEEFGSGIVDDVMSAIARGEVGPAAPVGREWSPFTSRLVRYGTAVAAGFALFALLRFTMDPSAPAAGPRSTPGIASSSGSGGDVTPVGTNPGAVNPAIVNGPLYLNGKPLHTQRLPPVRLVQYRKNDF